MSENAISIAKGDRVVLLDDKRVLRVEQLPRFVGGPILLRQSRRGKAVVATAYEATLEFDREAGLWRERE